MKFFILLRNVEEFQGIGSVIHGKGETCQKHISGRGLIGGLQMRSGLSFFLLNTLQHLTYSTSDHCLLLLETKKREIFTGSRKFHFEAWWTMEESLESVIHESWEVNEGTLLEKLGKLQLCLQDWSRTISRNKEGLKRKLLKEFEALAGGRGTR
ncbi:Hemopexin [Gossypium australe]|uniref:Hemopexin n=1 Tax=Gossypium australe TaxID=47621 RepID=A0A5B6V8X3_9ROSI|nr:Hemopexin [Gossypium australe]